MKTEQEQLDFINSTCNTTYKSMEDINWDYISKHHLMFTELPENFIREFSDKLDWVRISKYQQLTEDFIREFHNKVDWKYISIHQELSEQFIREFSDKLDWLRISKYQKLTVDFIREFSDKISWLYISTYQQLSEDFIREFKDKVKWIYISQNQKLSESFINEFKDWLYTDLIEDNWNYKDTEFLKQEVIDTGLYECYDDYFIAYKGIRSDRYSDFNFQYQYLPNQTYESWCDCSSNEDSFGLSVWSEEQSREYCNELVVKVKVNYEDVGRVVHDGGKIRCKKITILN